MKHIQMKTFRTVALLLSMTLFSKGYSQDEAALVPFQPGGVQIFFYETMKTDLKRAYLDNAEAMDAFTTLFNTPGFYDQLGGIEVTSASSPSGRRATNERLSEGRAQALVDYLLQTYPQVNPALISKDAKVVDIDEFKSVVETELEFPGRASVQALLNNNLDENTLLTRLAGLPPNVVEYLRLNLYPKVQYARVRILKKPDPPAPPPPPDNDLRGLYLRTNTLELLALTPSLGVEYRPTDNLGILLNGAWAGWDFGKNKVNEETGLSVWDSNAWKWWHLSPQVRYYLGSTYQLYVGGEFTIGEFNFKKTQGKFLGGGVVAGYQFKLADKLFLDCGLGLGALSFNTIEEYLTDGYVDENGQPSSSGTHLRVERKKDRLWFGPTNAFVTLSYKLF
ncbi:hypothetical protein AGMMS49965_12100 [Bacteroidia bacterium]|nr:hypothetical protein AGMMS49965_12100 [Bacteroidia bacterium]